MKHMVDINKTLDLVKLKFYNEWLYTAHLYDEGPSSFHKDLTRQVTEIYVDPIKLAKDANILDIGCGPGYFMDEMKKRGYTNLTGISLSKMDVDMCAENGHVVKEHDIHFLPQSQGFNDETVDFIFLRQVLEHSPYPIFALMEYNRLLKQGSKMYIEVPAPDCARKHEFNLNHYSIFGHIQLAALLERTGFKIEKFNDIKYNLTLPAENEDSEPTEVEEKAYCILVSKARPLDIK